ncbi:hypothetical protein LSH36_863g00048, partial [Paralvinella palmiformis]
GPEDSEVKAESKRFLSNLDCVELFRIDGNSTYRRSYMDGKLYAEVRGTFDTEMPRTNIFGKLTVTLKRIGTHVIDKREKYVGLPEIVIVLMVDGNKMIIVRTLN